MMSLRARMRCLRVPAILLACIFIARALADEVTAPEGKKGPEKKLPLPGEVFSVREHAAFLITPAKTKATVKTPWVWYAPALPGLPGGEEKWMFEKFLEAGMAVSGIDVGESYGGPAGRALYSGLYEELVGKRGLSPKPCLLARSRGGLMLYNWAAQHPDWVACIAGIYPVCDLRSYPGLKTACAAYGMTEELLGAELTQQNPIDRLEPLAKARVPIFHIHGDSDTLVPLAENSAEIARRYQALDGLMVLRVVPGQGHNLWPGWFQCQELVDFIIASAGGNAP